MVRLLQVAEMVRLRFSRRVLLLVRLTVNVFVSLHGGHEFPEYLA